MISKKDLLDKMDISYGQLYRWKREGLIPDEWFIKKSVSTGQETFFDETLIIPRIEKIKQLKDIYSIDEVKNFLNPLSDCKLFNPREVILIDEIDPYILKNYINNYGKKDLTLIDVIIIYIFSTNNDLIFEEYKDYDFSIIKDVSSFLYIIESDNKNYFIIGNNNIVLDKKFNIIKKISFEDIASIIAKSI